MMTLSAEELLQRLVSGRAAKLDALVGGSGLYALRGHDGMICYIGETDAFRVVGHDLTVSGIGRLDPRKI